MMMYIYLLVAALQFSCSLAVNDAELPWSNEIESSLAVNELSAYIDELSDALLDDDDDDEFAVMTPEGIEYCGSMAEIESKMAYGIEGHYVGFDDENFQLDEDTEKVIGSDERKLIKNPNLYPFTAMGRIERGCTGTFISPHVVLTAAHCIYNNGKYNSKLDFYRQKSCGSGNHDTKHKWYRVFTYKQWRKGGNSYYDIAWIIYKSPSPVHMPYTSLMPRIRTRIYIFGYPGDKEHQCLWGSSKRLQRIFRRGSGSRQVGRLRYEVDTAGGMSGSAIYYKRRGKRVIIGVHTTGYKKYNMGVMMSRKFKAQADRLVRRTNHNLG